METDRAYIKLGKRVKTPVEKWREDANHYTMAELAGWDGNIGRVCGLCDIVVLDIDAPDRVNELGLQLHSTYAVKTGSGGYHLYYKIKDAKKVIIYDREKTTLSKTGKPIPMHLGELQCLGQYVVCPPSIHPNGNPYQRINLGVDVLEIELEKVLEPFRKTCRLSSDLVLSEIKRNPTGRHDDPFAKLQVDRIWDAKVNATQGDQLFCSHPLHGSDTGHNLVINTSKNVWKCWRCNSGGGAALALAVKYGIIDCSEARRGALRGEKYIELLDKAYKDKLIEDPWTKYETKDIKKYKPKGTSDETKYVPRGS